MAPQFLLVLKFHQLPQQDMALILQEPKMDIKVKSKNWGKKLEGRKQKKEKKINATNDRFNVC